MEKVKEPLPTVFINNIDSYASKHIAELLSDCVDGSTFDNDEEDFNGETETNQKRAGRFQVVGTVSDQSHEDSSFVLERYFQLDRSSLLSKLMVCDVVIYNITQHVDQVDEAFWAVSALHNEMPHFSGPKTFILVSTVLTWACSKPLDPEDPELPFTDETYRTRRAHPNFKQHIDLEKRVVKLGKTNKTLFSTYVVASGLQYGMGEQVFHYFFKTSWLGRERGIPVFGDGKNIVPTIHISDLARIVQNVIEQRPALQYLLAVDRSDNSMGDIVKAVATALGPGRIRKAPFEESFLIKELSVMELDSLLVNLRMDAVYVTKLFSMDWLCEYGLVENIELVVKEYLQVRGLKPIRICVLGPPAVGKSTVCKEICEHYKLQYIKPKDPNSDTMSQMEGVDDAELGASHSATEDQEMLSGLRDTMEQNESILDDQVKELKDKLSSRHCRNQGFVLDGFPETYEQVEELFTDEQDGTSKTLPEFVLCLDASDDFLIDRVINLHESLVQKHNYEQDHFLKRLAQYRENNMKDETVINCFMEMDIAPLHLKITSSSDSDWLLLMQKVFDSVGPPRNYGRSSQELEEEEMRKAEERMRKEAKERAEAEQWEKEEARRREAQWKEWTRKLEEANQQEESQRAELEDQTESMRKYLQEHVMPTLTAGLIECCAADPENPVLFLADYLISHNPLYKE